MNEVNLYFVDNIIIADTLHILLNQKIMYSRNEDNYVLDSGQWRMWSKKIFNAFSIH